MCLLYPSGWKKKGTPGMSSCAPVWFLVHSAECLGPCNEVISKLDGKTLVLAAESVTVRLDHGRGGIRGEIPSHSGRRLSLSITLWCQRRLDVTWRAEYEVTLASLCLFFLTMPVKNSNLKAAETHYLVIDPFSFQIKGFQINISFVFWPWNWVK